MSRWPADVSLIDPTTPCANCGHRLSDHASWWRLVSDSRSDYCEWDNWGKVCECRGYVVGEKEIEI